MISLFAFKYRIYRQLKKFNRLQLQTIKEIANDLIRENDDKHIKSKNKV